MALSRPWSVLWFQKVHCWKSRFDQVTGTNINCYLARRTFWGKSLFSVNKIPNIHVCCVGFQNTVSLEFCSLQFQFFPRSNASPDGCSVYSMPVCGKQNKIFEQATAWSVIWTKLIKLFFLLWRYSPNLGLGLPPWNSPFHFGFLDLRQAVGLFGRVISSSQGLYLYTNTEKRIHIHKH
jgi:hypothetical protein